MRRIVVDISFSVSEKGSVHHSVIFSALFFHRIGNGFKVDKFLAFLSDKCGIYFRIQQRNDGFIKIGHYVKREDIRIIYIRRIFLTLVSGVKISIRNPGNS